MWVTLMFSLLECMRHKFKFSQNKVNKFTTAFLIINDLDNNSRLWKRVGIWGLVRLARALGIVTGDAIKH